jgi:hypothetical protein
MTEQAQNLVGQIQEQVQQTAQDFFGDSLGEIKNQLATHRSQLQELLEMLLESQEEGRAQLEQLLGFSSLLSPLRRGSHLPPLAADVLLTPHRTDGSE